MKVERKVLTGKPVSEGIALSKAYVYYPTEFKVTEGCFAPGEEEKNMKAFHDVLNLAEQELTGLYESLSKEDKTKAKIFAAHKEFLEDEEILDEIRMAIREERMNPDYAIDTVFTEFAAMLAKVEDPLIAGRAADLYDVKNRLLRIYMGKSEKNLANLSEDVIVIAHDLLPSDTATIDRIHVKGIITEIGGFNSHSAILARSFQIPAVLGVDNAMTEIPDGCVVAMDAMSGEIVISPDRSDIIEEEHKKAAFAKKKEEEAVYLHKPTAMKDGTRIEIGINIGSAEFDTPELQYDFVGLFRTEFLYMGNTSFPSEEEQFVAYKNVLENAQGRPVTLRTLDIGGDKTLLYMDLPKEENPFLGKRALRLCLAEKNLFRTQLRAALRASAFGSLQMMFPMVGSMEDIYRAKECVERAKEELRAEGISFDENMKIGIMIEIPSIALIADLVAEEIDFASVGSNDLTQYISAADRMNASVTEYYQNYSPAMVRLLGYVFEAFERCGKPVSVCGEMAGNPDAAVLLVGLGAKKLSMSASNAPGVKAALAGVSREDAKALAQRCKRLKTEKEVKSESKSYRK